MAHYYPHSRLFSLFLLFSILMSITQLTFATRKVPNPAKDANRKQPEFFLGHDGSFLIPGIGRVMVPPFGSFPSAGHGNLGGSDGNSIGGGVNGRYIPGGDDTFVPNPGFEVPNPARGLVPAPNAP
ncbi:putative cell wall protein [Cinnamomum micranthum f. kanehirae]|uniref:Putative cell wall protein n=1 Tax=Cinnamomum micranthum f. kanehirae TaxID=337451 RepID=A0A443P109_9MAGN|nr:putative cell wall protein [Cinnamomum micranthum f. kanehirae]